MGGDHGPHVTVAGAYQFLQHYKGHTVVLVGDRAQIQEELNKVPPKYHSSLPIVHAPENIGMSESPTEAIKKKKNSSMVVGLQMHANNEVDAFVSAGSTGAQLAGSFMLLKRIKHVKRPAIGSFLPSEKGMVYLIDVGANAEARPEHLVQFAIMAEIFVSHVFGGDNLTVGLLSNGSEASKGNEMTVQAHQLLKKELPNFKGNVEGYDIFKGKTDIIVCDGFTGNILLKMAESVMHVILNEIRKNIGKNLLKNLGAMLVKPAFRALKQSLNYEEHGGVPLLGVNGISIISHGKSSPLAIRNALSVAMEMKSHDVNKHIEEQLLIEEKTHEAAS